MLLFGKRSAAIISAASDVEVATAQFADRVRQRILELAEAYYDAVEAQTLVEIARNDVATLQRLVQLADELEQGNRAEVRERSVLGAALRDAQRNLLQREAAQVRAEAALTALMGLPCEAGSLRLAGIPDIETSLPAPPFQGLVEVAQASRPDLLAARLLVGKAQADLRVAHSLAWPEVIFQAGVTRQFQEKAIGMPDASSWGVGADVDLPLWNRNQGNIAKAESLVHQAELAVQAGTIRLRSEIKIALADYVAASAILTEKPQPVEDIAAIYEAAVAAYAGVDASLTDLMQARTLYLEMAPEAVKARVLYWKALHALNAAVGRAVLGTAEPGVNLPHPAA